VQVLLAQVSMVIGGCYSLWLFNRIAYANLKTQYFNSFLDINKREFVVFLPLILGTLIIGLIPDIFLNSIHMSVSLLTELLYF
jgi:NADH:ubiquinone oxidoreductase subunit 4 (subunit M)